MPKEVVLCLEEDSVRFTPSGEIAVIDAIKALSEFDTAEDIWEALNDENPEILLHCKQFHFSKNKSAIVVDSQGWEQIESLLFDYILDLSLLLHQSGM
jgi:hypothetical protein